VQLPDPGTAQEVSRLQALVQPHLDGGCVYVNEGVPILYYLTRSCLPSRYIFPEHLTGERYRNSLGTDQLGELEQTLARRTSVVVISTTPDDDTRPAARSLLKSRLQRDYHPVGKAAVGAVTYEIHARRKTSEDN
jgi:hypothetical protein